MAGGGSGGEKTEAPTPKKLEEARKKGNIARSNDLNGAVVLIVGLFALAAAGPSMVGHIRQVMTTMLMQTADPSVVSLPGVGTILLTVGKETALAVAPVSLACMGAGVAISVAQIGVPRLNF